MFLVFFALDSPGQKQAAKTKTKRKCTVRLIKTGNKNVKLHPVSVAPSCRVDSRAETTEPLAPAHASAREMLGTPPAMERLQWQRWRVPRSSVQVEWLRDVAQRLFARDAVEGVQGLQGVEVADGIARERGAPMPGLDGVELSSLRYRRPDRASIIWVRC